MFTLDFGNKNLNPKTNFSFTEPTDTKHESIEKLSSWDDFED